MQLIHQIPWPIAVAVCLGTTATVLANMISFMMRGRINERLSENERISYLWWATEVRKRFKQLYPGNKLTALLDSCLVMMVLCFIFLIRVWVFS